MHQTVRRDCTFIHTALFCTRTTKRSTESLLKEGVGFQLAQHKQSPTPIRALSTKKLSQCGPTFTLMSQTAEGRERGNERDDKHRWTTSLAVPRTVPSITRSLQPILYIKRGWKPSLFIHKHRNFTSDLIVCCCTLHSSTLSDSAIRSRVGDGRGVPAYASTCIWMGLLRCVVVFCVWLPGSVWRSTRG